MMNIKTYRNWRTVFTAIIVAVGAVSVVTGIVYILIAAVVIGMIILLMLRRRVKEVIYDERTYTIAYKAARLTVSIAGIGMAMAGAILLALNRDTMASTAAQAGFALLYATCSLLAVNLAAYTYYSRKLGGKNE
jgi:uncharacterized membrane protein